MTINEKTKCPSCGRYIIPRMTMRDGLPFRSFCPFCGALHKEFPRPNVEQGNLYGIFFEAKARMEAIEEARQKDEKKRNLTILLTILLMSLGIYACDLLFRITNLLTMML